VATHYISVVREATERDDVDVVFPLTNLVGRGILDGTPEEMAGAISDAAAAGLGAYVMKPLAGGNLIGRMEEALRYARGLEGVSAVALGVVNVDEMRFDLDIFNDRALKAADYAKTAKAPKRYIILTNGCNGCGRCVQECPAHAISLVDQKAHLDQDKCILCGYCAPVCPGFWIRVV
jgi:NAD-dependent dihydropyrimidine dehydrogenase PreA subunit